MGASGDNGSSVYQYGGSPTTDKNVQAGIQTLQYSGLPSSYHQYAPGLLSNLAGPTNYNAQQTVDAGNNIMSNVQNQNLGQYAQQALATGFNDNNALYNQELGQITDQTRSGEAARGIASTPYGAQVEGQTLTDFNNNWNNQLLQNQQTAAGTAGALDSTYGSGMTQGATVAMSGGNNPINALSSILGAGNTALAPVQSAVGDQLSYLQGGTQAAQAKGQLANQSAQMQNSMLGGLGQLGGSMMGMMGGK